MTRVGDVAASAGTAGRAAGQGAHLHVLQEWLEQEGQECPEDLMRLEPPPIPKADKSLWTGPAQAGHRTSASPPSRTRASNFEAQAWQRNS